MNDLSISGGDTLQMKRTLFGLTALAVIAASPVMAQPVGYVDGQNDRVRWENWFASLSPEAKSGAEYWAGQRSLPRPGSCSNTSGVSNTEWLKACSTAQVLLAPVDVRR